MERRRRRMEGAPSPEKRRSATCGMGYSGGRLGERHRRSGRSPAVRALVVTQSADYRLLTALTPSGATSTYPSLSNSFFSLSAMAFFHHVNALYGAVSEFCTNDSCPTMSCYGFQ